MIYCLHILLQPKDFLCHFDQSLTYSIYLSLVRFPSKKFQFFVSPGFLVLGNNSFRYQILKYHHTSNHDTVCHIAYLCFLFGLKMKLNQPAILHLFCLKQSKFEVENSLVKKELEHATFNCEDPNLKDLFKLTSKVLDQFILMLRRKSCQDE